MRAADFVVKALEREDVEFVFGYPGGAIMPVYDALVEAKFKHVLVRHEQGAALAADGYARASGKVGVCLATSGPGATNLVTGIANAFMDSVPMVAITGQVPTHYMGTDAFQETDMLGVTMSIVKHSFLARTPEDLFWMLPEAFRVARSGRPGPVLLDIPKDVQQTMIEMPAETPPPPEPVVEPDSAALAAAIELLEDSEQPIIYAGGGIGMANALEAFRDFVEATRIPVVTTLKGIGSLAGDHELNLGMLGMHGLKAANLAVQESDLLIVIGARLDDRATGKLDTFAPKAKLIHLDIDPAELGKLRRPAVAVRGDLTHSLTALRAPIAIRNWRSRCLIRKAESAWDYGNPSDDIYAPRLLRKLSERAGTRTIISCDVGQHQMWVAQHYNFTEPYQHLTSGGLGTMGYGLPAAIGAWLARPDHEVIVVSGDGSIMMNIQELATLNRYGIPIKILLLDNSHLGLVRQWQELFFEERFSEVDLSDNPEFVQVAESFGVEGMKVDHRNQEEEAIEALLNAKGPFFLHVAINPETSVWPLVPPGKSNADMMEGAKS
ncbi:acetolactate synthase 2 catalytic subunit [Acanthopleuribacter pedis]|uniref:Acetolactate synthase n=1 Tax=Acanthopleuribacter pedis TaxID=442870 RepID=A0A8J7U3E8_9BACT|nr:acetolactate synthase 2 catalytic subunit [Acanthopleuribacter pedis]MBO1318689.1 acetolactate synthase 2 catalytic subunit [Acanthopleuribacter pedis]